MPNVFLAPRTVGSDPGLRLEDPTLGGGPPALRNMVIAGQCVTEIESRERSAGPGRSIAGREH